MNNPLIYDFSSLVFQQAGNTKQEEDTGIDSVIETRMSGVCAMLTTELWDGFFNAGKLKVASGPRSIILQHFRTPGIDARLFIYHDDSARLTAYFICKRGSGQFKVMRLERCGEKCGSYTVLYGTEYGIDSRKPADLAYLREKTANLAANIRATFDSAFGN